MPPREFSNIFHVCCLIRVKDNLFNDPVNFMRIVQCDKHCLSYNGISTCCLARHRVVETSQWEERDKYADGTSTVRLTFSVVRTPCNKQRECVSVTVL
jgi:hypothetical protein